MRGPIGRRLGDFRRKMFGRGCESEGADARDRTNAHFEVGPVLEEGFGADTEVDDADKSRSNKSWGDVAFGLDSDGYKDDSNARDYGVNHKIEPALDAVEKIEMLF